MRPSGPVTRSAVIVSAAILISACSTPSLTQVRQFGNESAALSASAKHAFTYLDQLEIQRKLYTLASDPKDGPTDSTFTGFFETLPDRQTGQKDPRKQALALRLDLLAGLASYASALQSLAAANYAADIDSASGELNGALVSLGKTYQAATGNDIGLSTEDFGLIATAANAAGKGYAMARQRDAIRAVVRAADPAVQKAAALIATDLGPDSGLALYAQNAAGLSRGALQIAYNRDRTRADSTFDNRLARLEQIRTLYRAQQGAGALFSDVSKGTRAMAKAHAELVRAVDSKAMSSAGLAQTLAELQAYVKSVQAFQDSVALAGK